MDTDQFDQLVSAVLAGSKYRTVCDAIVRNIGRHELEIRRSYREAVKATKNTLHQVAGAYQSGRMRYDAWEDELRACNGNPDHFRNVCRRILLTHASTRERLPVMAQFYETIFDSISRCESVLDIACGLNPVALPWMPIDSDVTYLAYDIYNDQIDFLNRFFSIAGIPGHAYACDVAASPPQRRADVAFLFKTLPLLDHLPHGDSTALITSIQAKYLVVSFPVRSLGGREKGMAQQYESRFLEVIRNRGWHIKRFEFATELAFVVKKE